MGLSNTEAELMDLCPIALFFIAWSSYRTLSVCKADYYDTVVNGTIKKVMLDGGVL